MLHFSLKYGGLIVASFNGAVLMDEVVYLVAVGAVVCIIAYAVTPLVRKHNVIVHKTKITLICLYKWPIIWVGYYEV